MSKHKQITSRKKRYQNYHKKIQYLEANKKLWKAENGYKNLPLSKKEIKVLDKLLYWIDCSNMEYNSLSYLTRLIDGQKLTEFIDLDTDIQLNIKQETHILEELYYSDVRKLSNCIKKLLMQKLILFYVYALSILDKSIPLKFKSMIAIMTIILLNF